MADILFLKLLVEKERYVGLYSLMRREGLFENDSNRAERVSLCA